MLRKIAAYPHRIPVQQLEKFLALCDGCQMLSHKTVGTFNTWASVWYVTIR